MNALFFFVLAAASLLLVGCQSPTPPPPASPYAGEQVRAIKALSESEVEGLLNGAGLGYAKAAELNFYPGPKHVLELKQELELTAEQEQQTTAIREAMLAEAVPIGASIVEKEQALDQLFAGGAANAESMQALLDEIGALHGKLRGVHLNAHIEQRAVLTEAQVHQYHRLRGYHTGGVHQHHPGASS